MHTRSLLARRNSLLACEDAFEKTDRVGYEEKPDAEKSEYIEFKDSPYWEEAYKEVKKVLATRENLPNRNERKQMRIDKKKAGK